MIVAPGGGYIGVAGILEGREVADWFTSRGVTAFVLRYRVAPKFRLPVPLIDGQRAVRYVRANAERFGISPDRIGMIGFSAGGHLALTTAVGSDKGKSGAADPIERASDTLNFLVLGYPWLNGMAIRPDGTSQYCFFLKDYMKENCSPADYAQYQPLAAVTASVPPTFIYHTTTDDLVHADGSVALYSALLEHKVPVEMHIFAKGHHGTGMGGTDQVLSHWPELLELWLRDRGLLESIPPTPQTTGK
nr:alpha/beta hydrolase [Neorhizobium lilium]